MFRLSLEFRNILMDDEGVVISSLATAQSTLRHHHNSSMIHPYQVINLEVPAESAFVAFDK